MNASPQMLVEKIMFVITPSDHTDVNVPLDLLLTAVHRTREIQFVLVRVKQSSQLRSYFLQKLSVWHTAP